MKDSGVDRWIEVQGVQVPTFLYGTAWKEDRTTACVSAALQAGFVGIDTANQRKHYHEAGVGEALRGVDRASVFLQTKFTYVRGQDQRLPYDPADPAPAQVRSSFRTSLEHLGVTQLDSLVLHGPERSSGLTPTDWEVWHTLEALHAEGGTRLLGISNVAPDQLARLCDGARVMPAFVQNRCYADRGWDREVRAICDARGIRYQGFSLLTANRAVWGGPTVRRIAARVEATPAQVIFRFALHLGMLPLTGTTDPAHMKLDLESTRFRLTDDEIGELLSGV